MIISVLILFSISFFYIRSFLSGIKTYQLNNSAYKKRKKGETFKEWFFYTRWKKEIPKILLVLYYVVILIHFMYLITAILFVFIIKLSFDIKRIVIDFLWWFDVLWILLLALLFWSPKTGYPYKRWIVKRRGQKPKKK